MPFINRFCFIFLILSSCNHHDKSGHILVITKDSLDKSGHVVGIKRDTVDKSGYYAASKKPITHTLTGKTTPSELITFARSLTGTRYKYGSTDPAKGFDCSGFITYVFNHFGIIVPRRSEDFTSMNREISLENARPGDLILFTGTDSTIRIVGHMGIIVSLPGDEAKFIHSTSGKAFGVTESFVKPYYVGRYMKTIRIFRQNDRSH
jgi:lipoprotein Spr